MFEIYDNDIEFDYQKIGQIQIGNSTLREKVENALRQWNDGLCYTAKEYEAYAAEKYAAGQDVGLRIGAESARQLRNALTDILSGKTDIAVPDNLAAKIKHIVGRWDEFVANNAA